MNKHIFCLWLEYSAIPLSLIFFNYILQSIANAENANASSHSQKNVGLETMLILTISVFLYALSTYGHLKFVPELVLIQISISLLIGAIQLFFLLVVIFLVKKWGKLNPKSRSLPTVTSAIYFVGLLTFIFFCEKQKEGVYILDDLTLFLKNFDFSWLSYRSLILTIAIIAFIWAGFFYYFVLRNKFKIKKLWDQIYKAKSNDPFIIAKLEKIISSAASNNKILYSVYIKLISQYKKEGHFEKAYSKCLDLEKTDVYNSFPIQSPAVQGFLVEKAEILMTLYKKLGGDYLKDAEHILSSITIPASQARIAGLIFSAKKEKS